MKHFFLKCIVVSGFFFFVGVFALFHSEAAVTASNVDQLKAAIDAANANPSADRTILLNDGTYKLKWENLWIERNGVTIRSRSGNRQNVILQGMHGMNGGVIEFIFQVCADDVTIQDMTLENVGSHAIIIHGESPYDADRTTIRNLIIRDTYEQMVKVTPANSNPSLYYSENGLMENCLCYYTAGIGPQHYIGGIDVHGGKDWIVRNNIFKYIISPDPDPDRLAEHAIHFWSWSHNTLAENNLIIDCDRGIGFGLSGSGHNNGIIRNNIVYHSASNPGGHADVSIEILNSHDTQIYNNTVYQAHDNYFAAIKYFGSGTTNALIANNLVNMADGFYGNIDYAIWQGSGASGTELNNVVSTPQPGWFASVNPSDSKDVFLHIKNAAITNLIDKGTGAIPGLPADFRDFDGDSRPQGAKIDIGADEFCAGGSYLLWSR